MNLCILIATYVSLLVALSDAGVTPAQKQQLIDAHNKYRRDVAQGKVRGQPKASNMLELKWSDEAARKAQSHADRCVFGHDQGSNRKYGSFDWVGQNIAYWSSNDVTEGIKMWFDEVEGYTYSNDRCTKPTCLHYTQVAWAKTKEFGCGVTDCSSRNLGKIYLICNYGPGGNWNNEKPYETGDACSKCPSGTRCNNGLCA